MSMPGSGTSRRVGKTLSHAIAIITHIGHHNTMFETRHLIGGLSIAPCSVQRRSFSNQTVLHTFLTQSNDTK